MIRPRAVRSSSYHQKARVRASHGPAPVQFGIWELAVERFNQPAVPGDGIKPWVRRSGTLVSCGLDLRFVSIGPQGSASLHPGLYANACYRRLVDVLHTVPRSV